MQHNCTAEAKVTKIAKKNKQLHKKQNICGWKLMSQMLICLNIFAKSDV